jgi:hypothetical protein
MIVATMTMPFMLSCFLWALLLATVAAAGSTKESTLCEDKLRLVILLVSVLLCLFPEEFGFQEEESVPRPSLYPIERERKFVSNIFRELGPTYSKRAYRMTPASFYSLHRLLWQFLNRPQSGKKKNRNGSTNGLVTTVAPLSMAIRYFAGGRPEDIALVHGVSHTEVFNSVWMVVDAVLSCEELKFSFPSDHKEQRAIAAGFKTRSQPGFDTCCCCGAIDGMLLWTERPSDNECMKAGCGAKKFFCGRKHKFGLNLQGTCDSECRFLDICIQHPASMSDFLSFTTSSLFRKLEEKDFLSPGLCIFGDLAYTNCRYFATPYKSVSAGTKDDYNFYHSQIRIKIECAFGQLVSRWGLLRRALPAKMGIMKMTSLVTCLCVCTIIASTKGLQAKAGTVMMWIFLLQWHPTVSKLSQMEESLWKTLEPTGFCQRNFLMVDITTKTPPELSVGTLREEA